MKVKALIHVVAINTVFSELLQGIKENMKSYTVYGKVYRKSMKKSYLLKMVNFPMNLNFIMLVWV